MSIAILQLPELKVTDFHQLELAMSSAQHNYGKAAEMERLALDEFLAAVDTGYTQEAIDDLRRHADFAESVRRQAYRELSEAKQVLLAVYQ
jgi:hypothetical protein